jgi:hypothetical protein
VAIAAITVLPTIGDPRYRATAEIPLVLLAAVAIDAGLRRVRSAPSRTPRHRQTPHDRPVPTPVAAGEA